MSALEVDQTLWKTNVSEAADCTSIEHIPQVVIVGKYLSITQHEKVIVTFGSQIQYLKIFLVRNIIPHLFIHLHVYNAIRIQELLEL